MVRESRKTQSQGILKDSQNKWQPYQSQQATLTKNIKENNMKKKILSLLTAFAMVFGILVAPFTTASAADATKTVPPSEVAMPQPATVKSTIDTGDLADLDGNTDDFDTELNIHKLVSESFNTNFPFSHDGGKLDLSQLTAYNDGKEVKALPGVTFKYYKVNDAKRLDYMEANRTNFETEAQMTALTTDNKSGVTYVGEVTTDAEGVGKITSIKKGYYWFIETKRPPSVTGVVAKSVPFGISIPVLDVKADGTLTGKYLKKAHVYPKNTEKQTEIDKEYRNDPDFGSDSKKLKEWKEEYGPQYDSYNQKKTEIDGRKGSPVPYDVITKLIKGQIYDTLTWTDSMTKGLTYTKGSLKLYIKKTPKGQWEEVTKTPTVNYRLTERDSGFDLEINQTDHKTFVDELNSLLKENDVEFRLTYGAKINGEIIVNEPEDNNITFTPGKNTPGKPKPTNGELKVTKEWKGDKVTGARSTKVRYILETTDGKTVAQVTLDGTSAVVNAIEGVTFVQDTTDKYAGTFKGLKNADYVIREFVDKYKPTYDTTTDGQVKITNDYNPTNITPEPPSVKTYDAKFVKTDENGNRLLGAEFYVTRKNGQKTEYLAKDESVAEKEIDYNTAETAYQKAISDYNEQLLKPADKRDTNIVTKLEGDVNTDGSIKNLQDKRDKAFAALKMTWKWVEDKNSAYTFKSNNDGQIIVEGLALGEYALEEKTAPTGFAKLTKPQAFTVDGYPNSTYNINYELKATEGTKDAWQVKNRKLFIPQTGGIGSLIFIVAGLAIMGGAFVAYRKSQARA